MPDPARSSGPGLGWAAHAGFVAPARDRAELWRLPLGLLVVAATGLALNAVLAGALSAVSPDFWRGEIATARAPGQTPASLLVLLTTFAFFALGTGLAVVMVHRRPAPTLLGPLRAAVSQFGAVLAMLLLVALAIAVLPPWRSGLEPEPNLPFGTWAALLPLSLTALLIQVGAEEVLFRGYLQQQLAARFDSPWIWIGVPSLLFAAGHYVPSEAGENALLIAVWAAVFGVLMADLTARAGTLGPAIAVHMANNVVAILLISVTDGMSGLALYVSAGAADPELVRAWLPVDFATMVVSWLAARLALRR
ncbi:CPBP family intramembrane glutamic endopeptidase [Marinibacterium profundimaris]|uniref:CAAX protease n=1 Tax=Marinibacterium profundimaris TaxID=1679460 RepID=A0A225NNC3_9RHOB|nr:CPBP family intramembrane glutamic endopeptidase [Marinibacterium profundimaris]OWU76014.1 CAAX protease [Marinibacterium profundimaris]